ncbi:helix-turn-helix domain-containing protein [Luteibacter sp. E-22]|jgi:transcriptional regulator with XRE-family HTH domain|uniref:helix-turn-helix domain-containing protein n=1 Tax=Luteibacter sp. E-22 TaxID=3404050 RepID=UPI003CF3B038
MPKHVPKLTSVHKHEQQVLCALLRELRLATGLRQDQVAEQMGTSQTTISEIELGQRGVDLLVCRRLVAVYGADWPGFVEELERRLQVLPNPAAGLIKQKRQDT